MNQDTVVNDCWLMGQLAGIRSLERELADEFKKSGAQRREVLRQRLAQLNSWVSLVDDALTLSAQSSPVVTSRRPAPMQNPCPAA